jgi:alcohol dehydrogenase class IV
VKGFGILGPGRILFGRGEAAKAPDLIRAFGARGIVVHGATAARAQGLVNQLRTGGSEVLMLPCGSEPTVNMLEVALADARAFDPLWVAALGGGAVLDMGKALAAMLPAPAGPMTYLEVVGQGLPLQAPPLPFIALPTISGTGAEATKNAVIGVPACSRKVSLRDDRMLACIAIVDPALTDHCPRAITLASGLDAITQVIEPYVSTRANPFTDALTRPAIAMGLEALMRLMQSEDADARDRLAWVSLCGGLALANSGLGAVHGLAGAIGGVVPAAHGAICGALLGPVIAMNRVRASGQAAHRLAEVAQILGHAFQCSAAQSPLALAEWAKTAGLPGLAAQGLAEDQFPSVAEAALLSSSMKANPVVPTAHELVLALMAAK